MAIVSHDPFGRPVIGIEQAHFKGGGLAPIARQAVLIRELHLPADEVTALEAAVQRGVHAVSLNGGQFFPCAIIHRQADLICRLFLSFFHLPEHARGSDTVVQFYRAINDRFLGSASPA